MASICGFGSCRGDSNPNLDPAQFIYLIMAKQ